MNVDRVMILTEFCQADFIWNPFLWTLPSLNLIGRGFFDTFKCFVTTMGDFTPVSGVH